MRKLSTPEAQKFKLEKLLLYIDEICKKEDITYYLAYGTLLGAVREKGFIPWDEDIDIWMEKSDLKKFIRVYPKYEKEDLFFQTWETDKYYCSEPLRLCVKGTLASYDPDRKVKGHSEASIDIFLLDEVDEWSKMSFKYQQFLFDLMNSKKKYISQIRHFRYKILACIFALFPMKRLKRSFVKSVLKQEREDGKYLRSVALTYGIERAIYKKEWFENVVWLEFEGYKLPCPSGYDALLKAIYGDYMTPHTEGQRRLAGSTYILEESEM